MKHRILVTGGAGFIASHLCDAYLALGHRVAVIDDLSSGQNNTPGGAEFFELDIRDPMVDHVFRDFKPTVLCHHAAQMDVRRSVADPVFDSEVNIGGSLHLFELCKEHGVEQVLFASTGGAIYGEQDVHPAPESHPCQPVSPYGCAKLAIERYLHFYHVQYGIKALCLRYANVYGPRQNAHGEAGVVAIFSSTLLRGDTPTIFGDGKQTRDYVYIDDVVAANVAGIEQGLSGIYNIGTGVETSVNRLYSSLRTALGVETEATFAAARPGEQMASSLDASAYASLAGWRAKTELDDGLRASADFFRKLAAQEA